MGPVKFLYNGKEYTVHVKREDTIEAKKVFSVSVTDKKLLELIKDHFLIWCEQDGYHYNVNNLPSEAVEIKKLITDAIEQIESHH